MAFAEREIFRVLFLDKRNLLIADEIQQTGTVAFIMLICAIVHLIPRTAVLGAILITGFVALGIHLAVVLCPLSGGEDGCVVAYVLSSPQACALARTMQSGRGRLLAGADGL